MSLPHWGVTPTGGSRADPPYLCGLDQLKGRIKYFLRRALADLERLSAIADSARRRDPAYVADNSDLKVRLVERELRKIIEEVDELAFAVPEEFVTEQDLQRIDEHFFDNLVGLATAYSTGVASGLTAEIVARVLESEIKKLGETQCPNCGARKEEWMYSTVRKQFYCHRCATWISCRYCGALVRSGEPICRKCGKALK